MKKIMLAAVAASFVSTGASAVQLPAEGEVCSSIHSNISVGINNPELSDYRKCVMIQHDIDTAFTYKTFWVRNGDTFTSFPVETLAKMNRGERIDYIKLAIQQGLLIETLESELEASKERISELSAAVNALSAARDALEMAYGTASAAVTQLTIDLSNKTDELTAANIRAEELERVETTLRGEINDLRIEIADLEAMPVGATPAELEAARAAGVAEGQANLAQAVADAIAEVPTVHTATVTAGFGRDNGEFFFVRFTHEVAGDVTLNITQTLRDAYNAGWADKREDAYSDALNDVKGDIIEQLNLKGVTKASDLSEITTAIVTSLIGDGTAPAVDLDNLRGLAHSNPVSTDLRDFSTEPVNANDYVTFDDEAPARDATTYNMTEVPFGGDNFVTITVNGHDVFSFITSNDSVSFEAIDDISKGAYDAGFNDGFEAGYKHGYDDGYKDGYSDGYTDGFNDGVASVR